MIEPSTSGYTIYSKSQCKACEEAKKLIPNAKVINCDQFLVDDVDEFLDFIWSRADDSFPKSFPMIFHDGKYLGGLKKLQSTVFTLESEF